MHYTNCRTSLSLDPSCSTTKRDIDHGGAIHSKDIDSVLVGEEEFHTAPNVGEAAVAIDTCQVDIGH